VATPAAPAMPTLRLSEGLSVTGAHSFQTAAPHRPRSRGNPPRATRRGAARAGRDGPGHRRRPRRAGRPRPGCPRSGQGAQPGARRRRHRLARLSPVRRRLRMRPRPRPRGGAVAGSGRRQRRGLWQQNPFDLWSAGEVAALQRRLEALGAWPPPQPRPLR
jgi:hypothetical protein